MLPTQAYLPAKPASLVSDTLTVPGKPAPKRSNGRRIHLNSDQRAVITVHHHEVIIRRTDPFYKTVAVLEGILLIASSLSLIAVSGAVTVWAASLVGMI